ncbi:MAG: hypothetical protein OEL87_01100 [Nanoarchaeota archaeon]|nr:hypothetical protein [Nanoarchaeota archaeon]
MKKRKLEKGAESIGFKEARKELYKAMADGKILGKQDLKKYHEMRLYLKKVAPELSFPSMQSEPNRSDYNLLQTEYRKYNGF